MQEIRGTYGEMFDKLLYYGKRFATTNLDYSWLGETGRLYWVTEIRR